MSSLRAADDSLLSLWSGCAEADFSAQQVGALDLSGFEFPHHLNLSRLRADGEVWAPCAVVQGALRLEGSKLGALEAGRIRVHGPLLAAGCRIAGGCELRGSRFESVDCRGAVFGGDVWARPAHVRQGRIAMEILRTADFSEACFSCEAGFGEARFLGPARFRKAVFGGTAGFDAACFLHSADFTGACFKGPADFRNARFEGPVPFGETDFQELRLEGAAFSPVAEDAPSSLRRKAGRAS